MRTSTLFSCIVFLIIIVSCDWEPDTYILHIRNYSSYPITVISTEKDQSNAEYVPKRLMRTDSVDVVGFCWHGLGYSWKEAFEKDISVFIIKPDSLLKYSWEDIYKDLLFEVRYDLSWRDLEKLHEISGSSEPPHYHAYITFPPDSTMKNIHMYPPLSVVYEEWNNMAGDSPSAYEVADAPLGFVTY